MLIMFIVLGISLQISCAVSKIKKCSGYLLMLVNYNTYILLVLIIYYLLELPYFSFGVGYSKATHGFDYWYNLEWKYDVEVTRWLNNIPREKRTQVFDNKG